MENHPDSARARIAHRALGSPPQPSLWDWAEVNGKLDGRLLVIEYRDGHKIAGKSGYPGLTITSPEPHGIYLAAELELDEHGKPVAEVAETLGVLVPITDEVRCIHVYQGGQ